MTTPNYALKDYASPLMRNHTLELYSEPLRQKRIELKPSLLFMIQQNQFSDSTTDDSNLHVVIFSEFYDTIKMNGVYPIAIRLKQFLFFLRDIAKA